MKLHFHTYLGNTIFSTFANLSRSVRVTMGKLFIELTCQAVASHCWHGTVWYDRAFNDKVFRHAIAYIAGAPPTALGAGTAQTCRQKKVSNRNLMRIKCITFFDCYDINAGQTERDANKMHCYASATKALRQRITLKKLSFLLFKAIKI